MNETLYQQLAWGWMFLGLTTFLYLLRKPAPYGRHSSKNWGPMMSNKWGWVLMEGFVLLVLFVVAYQYELKWSLPAVVMIGAFTVHYINRSFVFPFRIKTDGKKMPVIIAVSAMIFNLVNGYLIGYHFAQRATFPENWFFQLHVITGILVFIIGMYINVASDERLLKLRKPGETGYKIPEGGLFRFVSCPNLFGECVEWLGFALMSWSLPGFIFFVWTCANVIPRGLAHHRWYLDKFPDYPKERKAFVPYLA
jgi:3-oxo-5-alpha-steroid 4-dehydrogenase 1